MINVFESVFYKNTQHIPKNKCNDLVKQATEV